eukprot:2156210-Rhodomonas_salina.1
MNGSRPETRKGSVRCAPFHLGRTQRQQTVATVANITPRACHRARTAAPTPQAAPKQVLQPPDQHVGVQTGGGSAGVDGGVGPELSAVNLFADAGEEEPCLAAHHGRITHLSTPAQHSRQRSVAPRGCSDLAYRSIRPVPRLNLPRPRMSCPSPRHPRLARGLAALQLPHDLRAGFPARVGGDVWLGQSSSQRAREEGREMRRVAPASHQRHQVVAPRRGAERGDGGR